MVSALISRCLLLVLGTLYPAYRSYKAIKNKDVREHVKWMMYWIVFALFTTLETFLDIFFSWFPFYYEIKILFILWVLSPATRGSSLLYKKLVHPMLMAREKEIDELIEKTKQQGYTTFLHLFSSGFEAASNFFVKTALNGQSLLGSQLKKSLSMNDVYTNDHQQDSGSLGSNKKMPETITEYQDSEDDDEDSSDSGRKSSNNKKPSSGANNSRKPSLNTRDFEIIDDNASWMPADNEVDMTGGRRPLSQQHTTRRQLPSNPSAAAMIPTNTASRRAAAAATAAPSNYKSNEMSHYGTVTRAKSGSRTRLSHYNYAQNYYDNNNE